MADFTDDEIRAARQAVEQHGSRVAAGRALNMSEAAIRRRLAEGSHRNLDGSAALGSGVPDGYKLGKITRLVQREGGSAMEWQHLNPQSVGQEHVLEVVQEAMKQNTALLPRVPSSPVHEGLTVYPDADFHLGMYAWKKESGEDYDLTIAEETLKTVVRDIYAAARPTHNALILDLGDGMHADNNNAQTERSGAHLDVDTRYDKVLHLATELAMWKIDLALQQHENIIYRRMRGNHDPYAARAVELGLYWRYYDNPRVTISRDPGSFYYQQYGRTMIAAHHGHEVAPAEMPAVMAAVHPEMWGSTDFRYAYLGHFHHKRKGTTGALMDERGGAIWEVFETIAPKDAWNTSKGHTSNRSMTAITIDPDLGETYRFTRNIRSTR